MLLVKCIDNVQGGNWSKFLNANERFVCHYDRCLLITKPPIARAQIEYHIVYRMIAYKSKANLTHWKTCWVFCPIEYRLVSTGTVGELEPVGLLFFSTITEQISVRNS